jgi:hypothetical protein
MTHMTDSTLTKPRLVQYIRDRATARARAFVAECAKRPPDDVIGAPERPHFYRWHVIPRNRWLNVYVHQFLHSDNDRALHDHPWPSVSLVLSGSYLEHEIKAGGVPVLTTRKTGDLIFRSASAAHRIELPDDATPSCWTLFITGPKVREWGFHCEDQWVHWTLFDGQKNSKRRRFD